MKMNDVERKRLIVLVVIIVVAILLGALSRPSDGSKAMKDEQKACENSGGSYFDDSCSCPDGFSFDDGNGYCVDGDGLPGGKLGKDLREEIDNQMKAMGADPETSSGDEPSSGSSSAPKKVTTPSSAPTTPAPKASVSVCTPSLSVAKIAQPLGVKLSWNKCNSDDFQFYKLVRSTSSSNPPYPGGNVILSTSNDNQTTHLDNDLVRTKSYYYKLCVVHRLNQLGCSNVASIVY